MAFEDLKDQLSDQLAELKGRIVESAAYNSLREKYENLSPGAQRGLILAGSLLILIVFTYLPYSYFSTSKDYIVEYDEKRQLIRKLLQASRTASQSGAVSNPPEADALSGVIRDRLQSFNLLPEQISSLQPIEGQELGGGYAPPGISQDGIRVDLISLNLKQLVDIGYILQNLAQGVRLVGLTMNPNSKDARYFDVSYKIARFSMPGVAASSAPAGGGRFQPPPNTNNESLEEATEEVTE